MDYPLVPALGRRSFLGLAVATTALVGLGTAGCTPSISSRNGSNRLRVATNDGTTLDTLDPLRQERRMQRIIVCMVFESLVDLDKSMRPVARLAESFETPDGGVTWDFKLRNGITFHDGKPLTPEDVIYSISRALDPNVASGNSLAGQLKGILRPQGIRAVDDRTVRFALDKKYVFFPNAMATQFARIYRAGTKDFAKPVGTGPFVFESFAPGQSFAATRFDKYWGDAPKVERVDVINYAEDSTRLSALINGDVDVLFDLATPSAPEVSTAKGLNIIEDKEAQWIAFALDTTVAPFNNPDVVRAIKMAVDRDRVIKVGLGGYGNLGYDEPIESINVFFADLPRPKYDPDAAKEILAQAGHRNGLRLPTLEVFDLPLVVNAALILQQQLKAVGIQFDIKRVSQTTYYDTTWLKSPFYSNTYARRNAGEILELCFTSNGAWNMSKRKDPEIDAAIEAAAKTTDVEEQKKHYAVAERLIAERDSTVIPVQASRLIAVAANVAGVVPDPVYFLDLRKAAVSS
ncbi:ABC transporter substrate-binding protein [Streptomyces sp. NPDC017964]|uniref:ABC transporter substrate-binding protein n=1 Tax=Streptomyces sp. NPDC017964 TaxID=3365022 RepID=UPI00378AAE62